MVVRRNPTGLDTKLFSFPRGLTLTELEATTSLGLTWLFALYSTWVAGHEAFGAKSLLILSVNLYESASDGETQSLALTCVATSEEIHLDVILLGNLKFLERLEDFSGRCRLSHH